MIFFSFSLFQLGFLKNSPCAQALMCNELSVHKIIYCSFDESLLYNFLLTQPGKCDPEKRVHKGLKSVKS